MKSNEIWKNDRNYTNWELRQPRFEEEMRPVFFQYLGITPGSHVLDGGCDRRWPLEYRKYQIETGIDNEIRIITERSRLPGFREYGLTEKDFAELIELMKIKRKYLLENIDTDKSFELCAWLNIIVAGTK
mgnify:CR=1 FL=1